MLSKTAQKALLKALHYTDAEIAELVDSETETEAKIKDGIKVYDAAGIEELRNNVKAQAKQEYIGAGIEIAVKNMKKAAGLEYDGKDEAEFVAKFAEKIKSEAGHKPDEILKKHEEDKKNWQQKLEAEITKAQQLQSQLDNLALDNSYITAFPKGDRTMPDSDLLLLAKNKLQIKKEGDKTIYSYNGQELKDDRENYLDLSAAMSHVFNSEKWLKQAEGDAPKGMGFGDTHNNGSVFKSISDVQTHMKSKGISAFSEEGRKFLKDAVEKNPELGKTA